MRFATDPGNLISARDFCHVCGVCFGIPSINSPLKPNRAEQQLFFCLPLYLEDLKAVSRERGFRVAQAPERYDLSCSNSLCSPLRAAQYHHSFLRWLAFMSWATALGLLGSFGVCRSPFKPLPSVQSSFLCTRDLLHTYPHMHAVLRPCMCASSVEPAPCLLVSSGLHLLTKSKACDLPSLHGFTTPRSKGERLPARKGAENEDDSR